MLQNIFRVHELKGIYSDHCKISVQIPSDVKISKNKQVTTDIPKCRKWSDELAETFSVAIQSDDFKKRLNLIESKINTKSTDETVENLSDALISAMPLNFSVKNKKIKRKHKHKKWYDKDCRDMKKSLTKQTGN